MMTLQEFCEKLFFEEETSDHERSILLVDIMNAIGFSKSEREICIHWIHHHNVLNNIFRTIDNGESRLTGSAADGMFGHVSDNGSNYDFDFVTTSRHIKLYTPRTNNINNPPLLQLDDNEEYDVSCFVEEDDNFPGYVKLSLAEGKTNRAFLDLCRRMKDNKLYLPHSIIMDLFHDQLVKINGPAHTIHIKDLLGYSTKSDNVYCIHYDMWPNSATSFITRSKPNNWPSNSMLENIKIQGCDVAPVGHHDSQNNDIQWRISFPGEHNLSLDLTDVQTFCYALIKIILKETLNTSQREVVSSFHVKHVMFWCVERCSCQWVDSNYINCLNICLAKLIEMIKARYISHYIIEGRNLFNSKMTEKMSKEIVDVLSNYDTTHVFTLDAFDRIFKLTHYNNALLKREALKSTIRACFNGYFVNFSAYVCCPSSFWGLYIPHNASNSLLKYVNILQNLKKVKGVSIQFSKYFVRSMVAFLYYAKYKESNKTEFLLASKRLVQKSLNLESSCIKLRGATFFLTNLEYSKSIEICDTFLTFPPRYQMDSDYIVEILRKVIEPLFKGKTTEGIENVMKAILPMFYSSVELKSFPANYDITQQNPVWKFRNFTNIFFHGLYMDVIFMTAEKWVVPDPIQYELLSLPPNADDEELPFSGIHLDPMFVCFLIRLLCYHSMGNVNDMAAMLTVMNRFITKNTFNIQQSCAYLNMLAYCQIKSGHHRQSVKYILQSFCIFPSRYNTASGYLKIVLQILNSLSIYDR
jgi:hypothetical protein